MSEELRCPFCGGMGLRQVRVRVLEGRKYHVMACHTCRYEVTEEAWNRRVASSLSSPPQADFLQVCSCASDSGREGCVMHGPQPTFTMTTNAKPGDEPIWITRLGEGADDDTPAPEPVRETSPASPSTWVDGNGKRYESVDDVPPVALSAVVRRVLRASSCGMEVFEALDSLMVRASKPGALSAEVRERIGKLARYNVATATPPTGRTYGTMSSAPRGEWVKFEDVSALLSLMDTEART